MSTDPSSAEPAPLRFDAAEEPVDRPGKKLGMWLFLFTELLFFGGVFLLYSVFRFRYPGDFHRSAQGENLLLGSVNTAVLLTSSLLMALAVAAVRGGRARRSLRLQAGTMALGVVFLVIKGLEWGAKISEGISPGGPAISRLNEGEVMFFGLYYTMTGIHALHLAIGIAVEGFMFHGTRRGLITGENYARLENTGLYWHFVDIVWIYLYPLFYLVT